MEFKTYTGKIINTTCFKPEDFDIIDIAQGLSRMSRYAGQRQVFNSVARHSIRVAAFIYSQTNDHELALAGLLHDASEAYICDIPSPWKSLLPDYKELETKITVSIFYRFNLSFNLINRGIIKTADMLDRVNEYNLDIDTKFSLFWESIEVDKQDFLDHFEFYIKKRNDHLDINQGTKKESL